MIKGERVIYSGTSGSCSADRSLRRPRSVPITKATEHPWHRGRERDLPSACTGSAPAAPPQVSLLDSE